MKRIVSNAELEVGELVYKAKEPGTKGYDLPGRYKGDKDQNDYFHVGVVLSVYPLRIRHMTTPAVKIDTKLGAWTHHGWCSMVEKEKWNEAGTEQGIDVDRLHACMAVIEQQLDQIYEMTGSPLPALKRGQLQMGSVTQIKDLDASSGGRR